MITVGASAYSRVIDFARMGEIARSVGALLFADIAHIAGLVAAGHHPSPVPHADFVTTTTHKTLRGPRGGLILCKAAHAKAIDSAVFPGGQGGPLMHVIAAKAVCFGECLKPEFKTYSAQIIRNAQASPPHGRARLQDRLRRHRQPPLPRRPPRQPARAHRQEGAGDARSGQHHLQQEHRAVRDALALPGLRHPPRHARGDHARHGREGHGHSRCIGRTSTSISTPNASSAALTSFRFTRKKPSTANCSSAKTRRRNRSRPRRPLPAAV
jgi:hypothetical protein